MVNQGGGRQTRNVLETKDGWGASSAGGENIRGNVKPGEVVVQNSKMHSELKHVQKLHYPKLERKASFKI